MLIPPAVTNTELSVVLSSDRLLLEWTDVGRPIDERTSQFQQELHRLYHTDADAWMLVLGLSDPVLELSPSLAYWRDVASQFVETLAHVPDLEDRRHKVTIDVEDDEVRRLVATAPLCAGMEHLDADRLRKQWATLNTAFCRLIKSHDGSVESFIHQYRPNLQLAGRIFFHLVENNKGDAPFAFLATYSTHVGGDGASRHLPLKFALQEYGNDRAKLLELLGTVYRAARESEILPAMLETGEIFHPLGWKPPEAYTFLQEVPLYEKCGILCRIPNWWSAKTAGARLSVTVGSDRPAMVGMDAILTCIPSLVVNGVAITRTEARRLLDQSEGLVLIKNKWVVVDTDKLQATLDAYDAVRAQMESGGMTLREAIALQLAPENVIERVSAGVDVGVSYGEWFTEVTQKLRDPRHIRTTAVGEGFQGTLRPYQQDGLNWLGFLDSLGFGACLADDMGLGKTIQLVAFLSTRKVDNITSLLVVPASLLANWQREIETFYDRLTWFMAHPSRSGAADTAAAGDTDFAHYDLVITTYGMVQRLEPLRRFQWDYVILDEAQAIKNPGTKQTKAVKALQAANRMILTGTPVENRLADLWSLFDFLNPGLLGNLKEFRSFSAELKNDPSGYGRLRQVISPFILRRLKTDTSIIGDLPDKVEMKVFASLSKKQTVLYRGLVDEIKAILEDSEGIQRKGVILSSLMKFKQLCNHPDQFLGAGEYEEQHSGKFTRLREICETIAEKREKMLIFTQFKELTAGLHAFLADVFGRDGLVLHGGVPVKKRQEIVDAFQRGDTYIPFMVLSLKAGGVGLNLTAANHIVHFDRWWNPAVENQATDRAFRIGQKKNVVVHKFITQSTIEEKIDEMLEVKMKLSNEVVASGGEGWITELDNDQLMELFRLGLS